MAVRMHVGEIESDERLVACLLAEQFPELAEMPIVMLRSWGTDHAIWRLGEGLVVRLPRIGWASGQPDFEAQWLPHIAPSVPIGVPEPVAVGEPGCGYPYRWAVHRWLPGVGASLALIGDADPFAVDVAEVIRGLWRIASDGAPPARGRARPLRDYDTETREAIHGAADLIDVQAATAVWEEALAASPHEGPPVWVHGDLEGNLLLHDGRLSGIVDWGSACVGDPAVDIQIVWSPLFTNASRNVFVAALDVDAATLARSRGAAVNQACAALPYYLNTYPTIVERSWHKLAALGIPTQPST